MALVAAGCVCAHPSRAAGDWLFTPFLGLKLDGQTNLIDIDQAAGATKLTLGGSVALLGAGPFGLEMDTGYTPGFFDSSSRGGLVTSSNVTTIMGNVLVAMPAAV